MTLVEQSREYLDKSTNFFYGLLKSTGLFSDKWIDDTIAYEKDLNREIPIKLQETFNRFMDDVQTFTNTNPFLVRNPWIITAAQAVLAITLLPFAVALAAGTTAFVGTFIPNYFVNALSSAAEQAKQLWRLIFKRWVTYEHLDHGRAELVQKVRWVRSPLDFATNFVKIMIKLATTPVRVIPSTVQESARNALDAARTVLNWPLFVILHRPLRKLFGFDQNIYDAKTISEYQQIESATVRAQIMQNRDESKFLIDTIFGYNFFAARDANARDRRSIVDKILELQIIILGTAQQAGKDGLKSRVNAVEEDLNRHRGITGELAETVADHTSRLVRQSQMLHQHGTAVKRHETMLASLQQASVASPGDRLEDLDLGPGVTVRSTATQPDASLGDLDLGPGVTVRSATTDTQPDASLAAANAGAGVTRTPSPALQG